MGVMGADMGAKGGGHSYVTRTVINRHLTVRARV